MSPADIANPPLPQPTPPSAPSPFKLFTPTRETIETVQSLSPIEWGLPPKFGKWRKHQPTMIAAGIDSQCKHHVNCSPTGSGKSPAYMLHALIRGDRVCVVTGSKGLQKQNNEDYKSLGLVDVRGRNNYKCLEWKFLNCDEGHTKCDSHRDGNCPYKQAIAAAKLSPIGCQTNYAMWLASNRFNEGLGSYDVLVLDEAHEAHEHLAAFLSVDLSIENLARSWKFITYLVDEFSIDWEGYPYDLSIPDSEDPIDQWAEWGKYTARAYDKIVSCFMSTGPDAPPAKYSLKADERTLKDFALVRNVAKDLNTLATINADTWVAEASKAGTKFDPIWPAMYNSYLFRNVPKVLLYSATITPKTMYLLGVSSQDFTFSEFDSTFPAELSPILWIPTLTLKYTSTERDKRDIVNRIDQIIRKGRNDRRGIVHTFSYDRQKYTIEFSDFKHQFKYNSNDWLRGTDNKTIAQIIEDYKLSPPPSTLVTPSATTGFDFPDDSCRYNIIMKVPIPPAQSKVMKARLKKDPEYTDYLTVQDLSQAIGRGNRNERDWCEHFIIDDSIKWVSRKARHLMTRSFAKLLLNSRGYVNSVDTVPSPPNFR
jgi:ATP-dependent DNA helicase DinG